MKYRKILILIIVFMFLSVFVVNTAFQKIKYKKIILEKEPDYIGSTGYGEELAIVTDGKLVLYNKEGEARNIELDIYVTKVYPLEESIWVIDDKLNLYQVTYGNNNQVVMSDVILSDVVTLECNPINAAAINSKGELYVWGDNSYGELGIADMEYIDEPTKIDYIDNVKSIKLCNMNSALITEDGKLFVTGSNDIVEKYISRFTQIDNVNKVQYINGDKWCFAVCEDGTLLAWYCLIIHDNGNIDLNYKNDISDKFYEVGISDISYGSIFTLGITSQGYLYYWGFDFLEGCIGKSDYNYVDEPRKIPDLKPVDSMYATKMDAYAKKGLVIYIIPGK